MATFARAHLESLLRTRKLDGTLTTAQPWKDAPAGEAVLTGLDALDARLGGGVPRGQLSSLAGPPSSGRTSVLVRLLGAVAAGGELAALVDTRDTFDPASAAGSGLDVSRLLWIRGGPVTSADSRQSTLERQVDRAVKALTLVLQAGEFGLVALDVADVPDPLLRALPFTTWLRLARIVEGSRTACLVVGARPVARSPGGVTIALDAGGAVSWSGASDRARVFDGLSVQPRVVQARRAS